MNTEWTLASYVAHNEALREANEKLWVESDRRYAEVKNAEKEALRVKEEADRTALMLAREIQTYKDTKANELREQIASERGNYATKTDLAAAVEKMDVTLKPIMAYIAAQQGRGIGVQDNRATIGWVVAFIVSLIAIGTFFFNRSAAPSNQPQIIYVPAPPNTLIPSSASQPSK